MKRAVARVAMLGAFAIAALGSCSIRHRSGDFTCDVNTDCESGRVCDNGYCVVLDAGKPGADANNCPAPCTSCNVAQKTCTVNCQQTSCTNTLTCPAGYKCDILCNTESSCRNGVNCQQSASCSVECSGRQACQNVVCGPGPCDVGCSGVQSCRGVACSSSCACDVTCTGSQSCSDAIQCTSFACRSTPGIGCTSVPAFCHSCN